MLKIFLKIISLPAGANVSVELKSNRWSGSGMARAGGHFFCLWLASRDARGGERRAGAYRLYHVTALCCAWALFNTVQAIPTVD